MSAVPRYVPHIDYADGDVLGERIADEFAGAVSLACVDSYTAALARARAANAPSASVMANWRCIEPPTVVPDLEVLRAAMAEGEAAANASLRKRYSVFLRGSDSPAPVVRFVEVVP